MSDIDGVKTRVMEKITSLSDQDQQTVKNVFEVANKVLTISPGVNTNTEEGMRIIGWVNGLRSTLQKTSGGKKRRATRRHRRMSSHR
jgi:hypothetical protein